MEDVHMERQGGDYVRAGGIVRYTCTCINCKCVIFGSRKSLKYTSILNTFCRQLIYMNCTS